MASFEKINYILRPNKSVERKLIIETLWALWPFFKIPQYTYLGMGSMWFADFTLAHKYLLISKMYSIEYPDYAKRAKFNAPYRCVKVIPGDTSKVLPKIKWKKWNCIIWLDYDKGLDKCSALKDIQTICEHAQSGTILIVTVNASPSQLYAKDEHGQELRHDEALRKLVSNLAPQDLKGKLSKKVFPSTLAKILIDCAERGPKVAGRSQLSFLPIFNFFYRDGAPMVTIGGMIADEKDKLQLESSKVLGRFQYLNGAKQFAISVPPLTPKEKVSLDAMLPCIERPTAAKLKESGLFLQEDQIDSYFKFYRYYPVFAELFG